MQIDFADNFLIFCKSVKIMEKISVYPGFIDIL